MLSIRLPPLGPPSSPLPTLPAPGGTVEELRLILASLSGAAPVAASRDPAPDAHPDPQVPTPEDGGRVLPVIDPGIATQPPPEAAGQVVAPQDPVPFAPEEQVLPVPAGAVPWPVVPAPQSIESARPGPVLATPAPLPLEAPPRTDGLPVAPQPPRAESGGKEAMLLPFWAGRHAGTEVALPKSDPPPRPVSAPAAPIIAPRPETGAAAAGQPAPVARTDAAPATGQQIAPPVKAEGAATSALVTALQVKIDQSLTPSQGTPPTTAGTTPLAPLAPLAEALPSPGVPEPAESLAQPVRLAPAVPGEPAPSRGGAPGIPGTVLATAPAPESPPRDSLTDAPPQGPNPESAAPETTPPETTPTDPPRHDPQRPDPPRFDPARLDPQRPEPLRPAAPVLRQVIEGFSQAQPGGFDLALDPQELGHVRMTLIGGETGSLLVIQAERPETLDLLRRHVGTLEQDLRNLGHSVTLQFGSEGQRNPRNPHAAPVGMPDPPTAPIASGAAPERRLLRGDHLDLRV